MQPSPTLQTVLESEPQTYATASADAKIYELPARLIVMICVELNAAGFDVPTRLWPGDQLELQFAHGDVILVAATVH